MGSQLSPDRSSGHQPTHRRWFFAYWRANLRHLLHQYPADVVVSVHALLTRPLARAVQSLPQRPPFISVVTDLVTTHAFWYDPSVARCLVPTEAAYQRGLALGLAPQQLRVTGLPIHPNFVQGLGEPAAARQALHLDPRLPVVLLVSGGDGMGPVYEIARAIDARQPACQFIIVTGRNQALRDRLTACTWAQPTRIYGFVDFMPTLMTAADVLISKAGPATLSEACAAGLPVIISGAIPGQEAGNVRFMLEQEAGVFAPTPGAVAETLLAWLQAPAELARRQHCARAAARPDAVWQIVEELVSLSEGCPSPTWQPVSSSVPPLRALASLPD
ncbi:MAG: glycosyltransferase [Anaerolineae bacterium]|nr:glycosyltransferase [Anaerolineae bacterium]